MTRFAPFALATLVAAATLAPAQTTTFSDPANLSGERVAPRTGRELPIDSGALGLQQLLRKLQTRASVLNIVAHPDDEDGGMLTLYARGFGARVADLSLTRGEGGQNAMTGDFEDALGLLRTQELLSNDRYVGVTQMFGTEVDFGFSKTKSEAFAKWTHERVLYDAVRAIRIYRPLVITSTWTGGVTDGHGQHQVSGEIAQEAFVAAGDPNVFPELTKEGILPWKPLKMYARVPMSAISSRGLYDYATNQYVPAEFTNYVTGQKSTTPPSTDIVVHEGARDPQLTVAAANHSDLPNSNVAPDTPLSYVQFARIGLGQQKSQIDPGFRNAPAGAFDVNYHLFGSRICSDANSKTKAVILSSAKDPCIPPVAVLTPEMGDSFFDGIDTSIEGLAKDYPFLPENTVTRLTSKINEAAESLDKQHPVSIAPQLADALQAVNELELSAEHATASERAKTDVLHELRIKHVQLNDALALALGLMIDATAHGADQVAYSVVPVWVSLKEDSPTALSLLNEHLANAREHEAKSLALDETKATLTSDHSIQRAIQAGIDVTASITRPYFHRANIEVPMYTLSAPELRNAPSSPPALTAWATLDYKNVSIQLGHVVHDGQQPVSIVPPASVAVSPRATVLPHDDRQLRLTVITKGVAKNSVKLDTPPAWKVRPAAAAANCDGCEPMQLEVPAALQASTTLRASVQLTNRTTISEGYRAAGYGDLPRTNIFTPATDRIVPVDLKLPTKRRIGYLPGTGDAVPEALASIGLPVTALTVADLTPENLKHFDTVILGVRTYNAHPDLHGKPTEALLDFARNGGNVVVQYQTQEFTAADAPYPLSLGDNEKVVDETSPVALLETHNALLSTPNKITTADFSHWIEERGHGFMGTWDAHYMALTETHDPGSPEEHVAPQKPQRGGLLSVQLGKGRWTYVAFALYRQLPEAVPGAFRIFVNLLGQ